MPHSLIEWSTLVCFRIHRNCEVFPLCNGLVAMLGRFRIVPFENEGLSSHKHLFADAANPKQSDLMDEADSDRKCPCK
ncbi:MAG: hypothetical protein BHV62_05075 [Eggerthella sp. 51_9]|nr:MAG: hypothetical protein BHV62_05075 [Eggerthella sp. 51_9]